MAGEQEFFKRWTPCAEAIARNVLRKQGLPVDDREEEISIPAVGRLEVWPDTGDVGLAKHRMSSRAANEAQELFERQKQPAKAMSDLRTRKAGRHELAGTEESESYHTAGSDRMWNRRADDGTAILLGPARERAPARACRSRALSHMGAR